MRADSALSHLYDEELCVATLHDGTEREVRWNRKEWCFHHTGDRAPAVCRFEDIKEWRPASIKP